MNPLQACRISQKTHKTHQKQSVACTALLACSKKGAALAHVQNGRKSRQQHSLLQSEKKGKLPLHMCALANVVVFPPKSLMPCPL